MAGSKTALKALDLIWICCISVGLCYWPSFLWPLVGWYTPAENFKPHSYGLRGSTSHVIGSKTCRAAEFSLLGGLVGSCTVSALSPPPPEAALILSVNAMEVWKDIHGVKRKITLLKAPVLNDCCCCELNSSPPPCSTCFFCRCSHLGERWPFPLSLISTSCLSLRVADSPP